MSGDDQIEKVRSGSDLKAASRIRDACDELLRDCLVALGEYDTATLNAIADDSIDQDGWLPKMIREYVSVWR